MFCESRRLKVVMPMRRPSASNSPPPLEPGEIDAVVWITWLPSVHSPRRPETRPSLRVTSKPRGAPIA